MFYSLAFLMGSVVGSIVTQIVIRCWRTAHGYFKVVPVDEDEGTYSVNISIADKQDLIKARTVILARDNSQK